MSDLRHLQRLLNELQPAFLEVQQSKGPIGAPVVSLTDYGPDHVTWNLPQLDVADNGDPTVITITGLPSYDFPLGQTDLAPDLNRQSTEQGIVPGQWSELQTALQQPPDHAFTISDTPITVSAFDFKTGLSSEPLTFNFMGFGPDPTLGSGYPPKPQQLSEWNQLNNLVTIDPSVPTIQELLLEKLNAAAQLIDPPPPAPQSAPPPAAPHHEPIHYIEGNMPIGFADGEYGGSWGHHKS